MSTPHEPPRSSGADAEALFVDLDGTLIAGDVTWESLFLAIREHPLTVCKIPGWFLRGRGYLKRQVTQSVTLPVETLPYRQQVIDFIKQQRALGTRVVLATASDQSIARRVAEHLGIFDDYLGTEGGKNLKGAAKLAGMEAYSKKHGYAAFSYVGDTWADVPIWKQCRHVYAVAPSPALIAHLWRLGAATPEVLVPRPSVALPLLRALQPWQWIESLLLAIPLILAGGPSEAGGWTLLAVAIVAFCSGSSATNILADLLNLGSDRRDRVRRLKPLAAGTLPVPFAPPLVLALLAIAFGVSIAFLPWSVSGLLAGFCAACFFRAIWIDRVPILAACLFVGMNVSRVLAGGLTNDVPTPAWLLGWMVALSIAAGLSKGCRPRA